MSNTNTPAAVRFVYDRQTCTRCGGTGSHSRCSDPRWGTTCFDCGTEGSGQGTGISFTAQAKAAQKAIAAFRKEITAVRAADVVVGDVLDASRGRGKLCRMTVVALEVSGCAQILPDGTRAPYLRIVGKAHSLDVPQDAVLVRIPTPDQVRRIADFARTLPGVTVVEV